MEGDKMMICTLVKYPDLYQRMMDSAERTSSQKLDFYRMHDPGLPNLAKAYNQMAKHSTAEILLFVHDDIKFISPNWDLKIEEALEDFDLVGVCGTTKYTGGRLFNTGLEYMVGKLAGVVNGNEIVRIFEDIKIPSKVDAVDGCFMAVKREHILKNHFDEQFDELFFYDIDLCLRSRCCVTDILVSHNKPKEYFGKYPEKMKPFGYYYDAFHNKHSLKPEMEGFQYCGGMLLKDYV